jgi:predicted ArsR family transcriptional regulator
VPAAVLALSDSELRAAATYYLHKHQTEISRKGVQARQAAMQNNMGAIVSYIKAHGSAQIPRLARELDLSPKLVSHYLQILVRQHKVKAEGWAKDRRYSL